jgi:hypothetical protein
MGEDRIATRVVERLQDEGAGTAPLGSERSRTPGRAEDGAASNAWTRRQIIHRASAAGVASASSGGCLPPECHGLHPAPLEALLQKQLTEKRDAKKE